MYVRMIIRIYSTTIGTLKAQLHRITSFAAADSRDDDDGAVVFGVDDDVHAQLVLLAPEGRGPLQGPLAVDFGLCR